MARILIGIEDGAAAAALAAAMRQEGWTTVIAADTATAVRLAVTTRPDAAVLQGDLAGGGALFTLRLMRSLVRAAGIPILVIGADDSDRATYRATGAAECFGSVVDPSEVAHAVRRYLTGIEPPAEAPAWTVRHPDRLAALAELTPPDRVATDRLDGLTRLTARLLGVPTALVSLVEAHRQVFPSQTGLGEPWATTRETPLSHSFCQWVVSGNEQLVVDDARRHPVLRANRAVADLGVVAYAGVPVTTYGGQPIGSFCAIDSAPHTWNDRDLTTLEDLARIAKQYLLGGPGAKDPAAAAAAIPNAVYGAAQLLHRAADRLEPPDVAALVQIVTEQTEQLRDRALARSA